MVKKIIGITFILTFALGVVANAHPGGTDSNGGHTCRTNCGKWGLSTGEYHYHNGGGSTSSNNSSTTTTASSDKDCSDFSTYDEAVQYWNAKGYTRYNDPEKLDGWGNAVDDGIPCEAPGGYDYAKINGSDAQIINQDKANGENAGYPAGIKAGYEGLPNSTNPSGSEAYKQGYNKGFQRGYSEGKSKLNTEKEAAEIAGFELGKKQDEIVVPELYGNPLVKGSFEDGFSKGVKERDKEEKDKYFTMGYKDGKKDIKAEPKDVKGLYLDGYQEGYKKGQKVLQEKYNSQGYNAAFKMLNYKSPKLKKELYQKWYKDGFISNKEVKIIAKAGYNLGKEGEEYQIPNKYKKGQIVFKDNYDLGLKEFEEKKQIITYTAIGGFSSVLLGLAGRRLYLLRKKNAA